MEVTTQIEAMASLATLAATALGTFSTQEDVMEGFMSTDLAPEKRIS
jgi:hypothetical protein